MHKGAYLVVSQRPAAMAIVVNSGDFRSGLVLFFESARP